MESQNGRLANRDVQVKYQQSILDHDWDTYHVTTNPRRTDYIVSHVLVADPDFGYLESLTKQIEEGALAFIQVITALLVYLDE